MVILLIFVLAIHHMNILMAITNEGVSHEPFLNQSGDYGYKENEDGTVTITNYTGTKRSIAVPSELDGLPVTRIGNNAFSNIFMLLSVEIPDSVNYIGSSAFNPNMMLRTVTIHNATVTIEADAFPTTPLLKFESHSPSATEDHANKFNQYFEALNQEAGDIFQINDQGVITAYLGPSGEVEIPEMIDGIEVTEVADRVFYQKNLTSLILPDTIKTIGRDAFRDNQLTSLTIPSSVTYLGNAAFYQNHLSSLTIEEGITRIGEHAFAVNHLEAIDLPNSVTRIDNYAFLQNRFTSITLPENITYVGDAAFGVSNARYVTVHNPLTYIGDGALENGRMGIPSEVIIGHKGSTAHNYAEENNRIFKDITTAPELQYEWIKNEDQSVTITNYLGQDKVIEIPDEIIRRRVTGIDTDAFHKIELEAVYLFDQAIKIHPDAFSGNDSNPSDLLLVGHKRSTAKEYAEASNHSFEHILTTFPNRFFDWTDHGDGTATISNYKVAISDRVVPRELVLPDELDGLIITGIGESVFSGKGLGHVTLPKNSKIIAGFAFHWNDLIDVEIPNGVTYIGENAFNSNQLTRIVIPESVNVIGRRAFDFNQDDSADFTVIGAVGSIAESYANDYQFSFQDISELQFEWIENDDGTATVTNYLGEAKHLAIPKTLGGLVVTEIGDDAFSNLSLASVELHDHVERIGESAFSKNHLTSIIIPESLRSLGKESFSHNQLSQVEIRSNNLTIGANAFDANQADPTDLLLISYDPSSAKDHAEAYGYSFMNASTQVILSVNGSVVWKQSHSITIDVSNFDQSESLQYAWSTNENTLDTVWSDFINGETVTSPIETGDYYLHIRGNSLFGASFSHRSDVFKLDNTKPSLTITPSTLEVTHDDIELLVEGFDQHSGIKSIQAPDGRWHEQDTLSYSIKNNGIYQFTVEDMTGHQSIETISINNIDKSLSFEIPTISPISPLQLTEQPKLHTTEVGLLRVKDWRETENNWRVELSAKQLQMSDGDYQLPIGTIRLKPLQAIHQVEGNGVLPQISQSRVQALDDGNVILAEANQTRGVFDLVFPESALEIVIDPTTVLIDNSNDATYTTTISWGLISAP